MTQLTAGKPEPLGAHFDGKGVNFTLFSAHAERVELCVFDGEGNEHRYDLPARTGDTWHGYLAGGRPGMHYGFRVHGPWDPAQGHWFNPAKLLIDPCAHRVDGEFKDDPLFHVGYGEPDHRDSAPVAPKSVVVNDTGKSGKESGADPVKHCHDLWLYRHDTERELCAELWIIRQAVYPHRHE